MKFNNRIDENGSYLYQPSFIAKGILVLSLVIATFVIPYALFIPQESVVAEKPISKNNQIPNNVDGVLPPVLTFDADSSIPSTATISVATPFEGGWHITDQKNGETNYNYAPLNCTVTTIVSDMMFTSTGKNASLEALSEYLGSNVLDNNKSSSVSELTYNITSTSQFVGVGSMLDNKYEWTYARALTTLDKSIVVSASCLSKEAIYEMADTLRGQFGILVKP